jgi:hypothetical protein
MRYLHQSQSFSVDLSQVLSVTDGSAKEEWYSSMWRFLTKGELCADKLEGRKIKRLAVRDNEIYKQSYLQPWLKCVAQDKPRDACRSS